MSERYGHCMRCEVEILGKESSNAEVAIVERVGTGEAGVPTSECGIDGMPIELPRTSFLSL